MSCPRNLIRQPAWPSSRPKANRGDVVALVRRAGEDRNRPGPDTPGQRRAERRRRIGWLAKCSWPMVVSPRAHRSPRSPRYGQDDLAQCRFETEAVERVVEDDLHRALVEPVDRLAQPDHQLPRGPARWSRRPAHRGAPLGEDLGHGARHRNSLGTQRQHGPDPRLGLGAIEPVPTRGTAAARTKP